MSEEEDKDHEERGLWMNRGRRSFGSEMRKPDETRR
jgi:hypothetical protein